VVQKKQELYKTQEKLLREKYLLNKKNNSEKSSKCACKKNDQAVSLNKFSSVEKN
jgi:hypothetical protein